MPKVAHSILKLPYDYKDLEPAIGEETMRLHHTKHHKSYCDKLNELLSDEPALVELDIEHLVQEVGGADGGKALQIKNNAGGVYNHQIWWPMMSPKPKEPTQMLQKMINDSFGSMKGLEDEFKDSCTSSFGSSWVWMVSRNGVLDVVKTKMQDNPLGLGQGYPLLGCDLWEHAFYLDYRNRKQEWINAFWKKVNWAEVENRLHMSETNDE
jgi:Fe-Mn family superoxide dismutase